MERLPHVRHAGAHQVRNRLSEPQSAHRPGRGRSHRSSTARQRPRPTQLLDQFRRRPGLPYLLTTFVPRLRAPGLDDLATCALVTNPAKAFSLKDSHLSPADLGDRAANKQRA